MVGAPPAASVFWAPQLCNRSLSPPPSQSLPLRAHLCSVQPHKARRFAPLLPEVSSEATLCLGSFGVQDQGYGNSSRSMAPPQGMQVRDSRDMGNSPLVVVHVALECILGLLSLQALLIIVPLLLAHLISASATQASRPPTFWIRAFERAAHGTDTMCARQGMHADSSGPNDNAVFGGAQGGRRAHLLQL